MGIITTIPEKCRRCYTCVRECPAKAIKVEHGQATVIEDRCLACGNCIKVCAMKAKQIEDGTEPARRLLGGPEPVFACLAPSFPAAFADRDPGQVLSALRKLGAAEVWNVAFGAELVSRAYRALFDDIQNRGRLIVASPCPAIVSYVEQYAPALVGALAPIVSPMIATGRAIRKRHGQGVKVIFIGPCTAKKAEIRDPHLAGAVDCVLTYGELQRMFDDAGIALDTLKPGRFDGPSATAGETFPLPGGLLHAAGLSTDILANNIISVEGKDRVLSVLNELAKSPGSPLLVDALFCEGCISGPIMRNELSVFARKQILLNHISRLRERRPGEDAEAERREFEGLDLGRSFSPHHVTLPMPSEEEIAGVLASMKKATPADQLNCGACGYPSCREKAIAVYQGLAEAEMCLPYLVEELEVTCQELQKSSQDLASTQEQLAHSERLASLGQLSAGVAHEINNPLGTILLFSHVLQKQLEAGDKKESSLRMIVSEATRCKNIVRGLLDFARKSRVSKSPTNVIELIREVTMIMEGAAKEAGIRLLPEVDADLPVLSIDGVQVKQMLVNLVQNSIDAIDGEGEVRLAAHWLPAENLVEIAVSDNGRGIPKELLAKVFTPFFTTKKMGKGTGLGLAIAYGVVKMHSGDIAVTSEEGKGTTVRIRLPLAVEDKSPAGAEPEPPAAGARLVAIPGRG